jgi:hypothetical protein
VGASAPHSPDDISDAEDLEVEEGVGDVASLDLRDGLRTEGIVAGGRVQAIAVARSYSNSW